jgi:hypothetical protein
MIEPCEITSLTKLKLSLQIDDTDGNIKKRESVWFWTHVAAHSNIMYRTDKPEKKI